MRGFDALKKGQNALSLIWCQIFQSQVIWSNMFFLQMLYWHVSKSQLKFIMLLFWLSFGVAEFLPGNCMLLNLTLETSLFLILPTSLPALFMSRLKLERYYEGFVRRGDVGTAIICRSCWDNAERGHRGRYRGGGDTETRDETRVFSTECFLILSPSSSPSWSCAYLLEPGVLSLCRLFLNQLLT